MHIDFLNVGQGDCTLVTPPSGDLLLIDCADSTVAVAHLQRIRQATRRTLGTVIVSHSDLDHCGGVIAVLEDTLRHRALPVTVYADIDRHKNIPKAWRDLIAFLQRNYPDKLRVRTVSETPAVVCEDSSALPVWSVKIVHPDHVQRLSLASQLRLAPNPLSYVVEVTLGPTSVLVAGDAHAKALIHASTGPVSVLRAPHHGARLSGLSDMYSALEPSVAVVSVGTNNRHEHPHVDHIMAARAAGCAIACTQLTARCCLSPVDVRANFLPRYRRYDVLQTRHARRNNREVPCAGSVFVTLRADGYEVEPDPLTHKIWVESMLGDRALCVMPQASQGPPKSPPPIVPPEPEPVLPELAYGASSEDSGTTRSASI